MEPKNTLRIVPPARAFKPREGQRKFLDKFTAGEVPAKGFSGQFPTGYGKTIIAAMAFRALVEKNLANRMLLIVANNQQASQAKADFGKDCKLVGLDGAECWPVTNNGSASLASVRNDANVFITTVQTVSASYRGGVNCIEQLLGNGKWFVVADEYHHYGEGKDWGNAVQSTCRAAAHYLALSATPFNRAVDTVFGAPDFIWSYSDALTEGAVKFFELKGAKYGVTLVDQDNNAEDLTTCDLRQQKDPDKFIKKKALRYSDKYVQPILRRAVNSLIEKRSETGLRLQMLVRAHGCFHAACLAKMLADITDYKVDWVGSGDFGRKDFENDAILARFVPGKDKKNRRKEPELDILVQVGMCSEGSDTVNVVEIVDLGLSTFIEPANTDRQFIGRGARVIKDANGDPVEIDGTAIPCTVWVPSDSPIAKLHGHTQFQKWIDHKPLNELEESNEDEIIVCPPADDWELRDLSISTRLIKVEDCELIEWLEGDQFPMFAKEMAKTREGFDILKPEDLEFAKDVFRKVYRIETEEKNKHDELERNKMVLNEQVKKMAGHLMRLMIAKSASVPKSIYGDIIKRINAQIARQFGFYRNSVTSIDQVADILVWLNQEAAKINTSKQPPMWAI
jgi:superfamily II DNA or RNA helicase